MSGDRLAQIEDRMRACAEDVQQRPYSHPIAVGWYAKDVVALVEIAKAARQVNETLHLRARTTAADEARLTQWGVELNALNVALARLDSEATE